MFVDVCACMWGVCVCVFVGVFGFIIIVLYACCCTSHKPSAASYGHNLCFHLPVYTTQHSEPIHCVRWKTNLPRSLLHFCPLLIQKYSEKRGQFYFGNDQREWMRCLIHTWYPKRSLEQTTRALNRQVDLNNQSLSHLYTREPKLKSTPKCVLEREKLGIITPPTADFIGTNYVHKLCCFVGLKMAFTIQNICSCSNPPIKHMCNDSEWA